ncbi:cation transporter [Clostridiaceae bacterium HSG29]|nr:cation transporter [Clostridiaceae bacterium HSG29]
MKRKFILNGLHCSTCASKIENAIKMHKDFNNVEYYFATSSLIVFTNLSEKESINIIDKIVKIYEQGVSVISANESKFTMEINKPLLFRISISLILFILALTINIFNEISVIILMLAYFIIGYDILLRSIKDLLGGRLFDENFLMTIATIGAIGIKEYHEAVAVMLFYTIWSFNKFNTCS